MDHVSDSEKEEKEKKHTVNYTKILFAKRQIVQTPSIGHSSAALEYGDPVERHKQNMNVKKKPL